MRDVREGDAPTAALPDDKISWLTISSSSMVWRIT